MDASALLDFYFLRASREFCKFFRTLSSLATLPDHIPGPCGAHGTGLMQPVVPVGVWQCLGAAQEQEDLPSADPPHAPTTPQTFHLQVGRSHAEGQLGRVPLSTWGWPPLMARPLMWRPCSPQSCQPTPLPACGTNMLVDAQGGAEHLVPTR